MQNLLELVGVCTRAELGFGLPRGYLLGADKGGAGNWYSIWLKGNALHGADGIVSAKIDGVNDFAIQVEVLRPGDLDDCSQFD